MLMDPQRSALEEALRRLDEFSEEERQKILQKAREAGLQTPAAKASLAATEKIQKGNEAPWYERAGDLWERGTKAAGDVVEEVKAVAAQPRTIPERLREGVATQATFGGQILKGAAELGGLALDVARYAGPGGAARAASRSAMGEDLLPASSAVERVGNKAVGAIQEAIAPGQNLEMQTAITEPLAMMADITPGIGLADDLAELSARAIAKKLGREAADKIVAGAKTPEALKQLHESIAADPEIGPAYLEDSLSHYEKTYGIAFTPEQRETWQQTHLLPTTKEQTEQIQAARKAMRGKTERPSMDPVERKRKIGEELAQTYEREFGVTLSPEQRASMVSGQKTITTPEQDSAADAMIAREDELRAAAADRRSVLRETPDRRYALNIRKQAQEQLGIDLTPQQVGAISRGQTPVLTPAQRSMAEGMPPPGMTPPPTAAEPALMENRGVIIPDVVTPAQRGALQKGWAATREFVEDDWLRVKKMQEGANVREGADPYTAETLFHGRVGTRVEEAKQAVETIDADLVQTSRKLNVPTDAMAKDIDRYLIARHAPERNAVHGDGAAGITNADAAQAMQQIASSPHGQEVARIAEQLQEINSRTLDTLLEGRVILPDLYKTLRETYPHHIPLQRIMDDMTDEDAMSVFLGSRPLDVKGTGVIRAKGSSREVADLATNIVSNYEQAILRAEKNRVNLATLTFARDNPTLGLFEEIKPKAIGKSFDDERILFEKIDDPTVLTLREDGELVYLKINNPNLAVALKGLNRHQAEGVFRVAQVFTRTMSSLATRYNPEFAFTNKIRDLQEAATYALSKSELGAKGAARSVVRDPQSMKAVIDGLRGVQSEGARLYRQMRLDGGTTGGLGLSSRKQVELNLDRIRKVNRSSPRKAADMVLRGIDHWNTIFEDSTRLSVYRSALDGGATREQAARMAKEASVNFNKFGKGGPQINALYMFANASIQGSAKMLRAMKNPKVAAAVTTTTAVAVAATNQWNDSIDPEWRDKVTKWDRINSLPVMLPPSEDGSVNYVSVPVSWGIKPIKVAMDFMVDAMSGRPAAPGTVTTEILTAVLEGYNPAGGTDIMSAATPTLLDLPVELARNKAWHGGQIKPDWDRNAPESIQYFPDLTETTSGRAAVAATEQLSGAGIEISPADVKYAYEFLIGGVGRFATKTGDTAIALAKGESPQLRDVPVASRFLKSRDPARVPADREGADMAKGLLDERARANFERDRVAQAAYESMKDLSVDAVRRKAFALPADVREKVLDLHKESKLGLTAGDRLVKQLGVASGDRARYIHGRMQGLPPNKRLGYLRDLRQKKIATDDVLRQLAVLRSRDGSTG